MRFEDIYSEYFETIRSFIQRRVSYRDVADDLAQDTFCHAFKAIQKGSFDGQDTKAWLHTIARNITVDYYRRNHKSLPMLLDEDDNYYDVKDSKDDMQIEMEKSRSLSDLAQLIDLLPKDQKEVLKRHMLDEVGFKDIAEERGVSINTVLGQKRYALINLRKLIEKHNLTFTY